MHCNNTYSTETRSFSKVSLILTMSNSLMGEINLHRVHAVGTMFYPVIAKVLKLSLIFKMRRTAIYLTLSPTGPTVCVKSDLLEMFSYLLKLHKKGKTLARSKRAPNEAVSAVNCSKIFNLTLQNRWWPEIRVRNRNSSGLANELMLWIRLKN